MSSINEKIMNRSKPELFLHKITNYTKLAGIVPAVRFLIDRYIKTTLYPRYISLRLDCQSTVLRSQKVVSGFQIKSFNSFNDIPDSMLKELDSLITYSNVKAFDRNFSKASLLWVVFLDNRICGYCWSVKRKVKWKSDSLGNGQYLYDMEIFITFRGKGLGSSMVGAICKKLIEDNNCSYIFTDVHYLNHPSLNTFYKCGFVVDRTETDKS